MGKWPPSFSLQRRCSKRTCALFRRAASEHVPPRAQRMAMVGKNLSAGAVYGSEHSLGLEQLRPYGPPKNLGFLAKLSLEACEVSSYQPIKREHMALLLLSILTSYPTEHWQDDPERKSHSFQILEKGLRFYRLTPSPEKKTLTRPDNAAYLEQPQR